MIGIILVFLAIAAFGYILLRALKARPRHKVVWSRPPEPLCLYTVDMGRGVRVLHIVREGDELSEEWRSRLEERVG